MRSGSRPAAGSRGFTLIELLVTITVLAVVMVVIMAVITMTARSKTSTTNSIESAQSGRVALEMMARDLRSAGYGADLDWSADPQPPIAYVDSLQVLLNADFSGALAPLDTTAYNPAGDPKPYPLEGSPWAPPIKYRTGAETIRWTLDVNDDGVVNANDVADTNGVDAQRTPNPNDYVLVRQTYGDSATGIAGNNGGRVERIALVRRPGGGIPPMFTVYLKGSSTPWNWSDGPVPKARLMDIQRIRVQVVSSSARPDWRGQYAQNTLRTDVNSLRNVPNFGDDLYVIDGYVYVDTDHSGSKGSTEAGLANATVRLGSYATTTDSAGYYVFHAPAGSFVLRHFPPFGYGSFGPDSQIVAIPPASTHSFADTARTGGRVYLHTWNDLDGDGVIDAGEPNQALVRATVTQTGELKYTDASGLAQYFGPVGTVTLSAVVPDSMVATTPNPVSTTMTNGGSVTVQMGFSKNPSATVRGRVYRDNNRNGNLDAGEPGMSNVWVGVSNDGGYNVQGYEYTDANGDYTITVPANQPPGTSPYSILCIVPSGYFATSTTSINGIFLNGGQVLSNQNFGVVGYQVITLNANRVLSLGSADMIEKDWSGGDTQWDTKGHQDVDLILGADASGTDQISSWFNLYNANPLFNSDPSYTRSAPQSVLSLAVDRLDTGTPIERPDVVTGTRKAASGNFFVWLDQNTSGNLGYLPTSPSRSYTTADLGDVQAVLTLDCAGGSRPDVIVGTKSPTVGRGTFEIWQSDDAVTPAYTRQEIYPSAGSIPGGIIGEVTGMALADFDADGDQDLVVVTRTANYTGEILIFKNIGRTNGSRFLFWAGASLTTGSPTSVTCLPVDNADTRPDIVVGLQTGVASGKLQYYYNNTAAGSGSPFAMVREAVAPGIVVSLSSGDLGGVVSKKDIAVGWRQSETSYTGGIRIYYTDGGTLPASGTDPSAGSIVNMVPASTTNNFNYGVQPSTPSAPYFTDLAVGVKITSSTGALVVFIR